MRSYFQAFQAFKEQTAGAQDWRVQLYWNKYAAEAAGAVVFDGIPFDVWVQMPMKREFMRQMNDIAVAFALVEWNFGENLPLVTTYTTRPTRN